MKKFHCSTIQVRAQISSKLEYLAKAEGEKIDYVYAAI